MKRIFDVFFALVIFLIVSPLFLLIAILIKIDSKGSVFFKQVRVGECNVDFIIYKFRTMKVGSDKLGLITIGDKDPRVTRIGYFLRKSKLDELPQLINVFIGNMSFVGPRPEVRNYVDLYNEFQRKVLFIKPGITDLASIKYRNENEILSQVKDPKKYYETVIMAEKIKVNLAYNAKRNLYKDILVILITLKILRAEKYKF